MKALVTGGAGFIGSHLVEALLGRGYDVTVVDDFNDFYDPQIKRRNIASAVGPRCTVVEADICEAGKLRQAFTKAGKFDVLVHLAARAGVRPSLLQPKLYNDVNVGGTLNLLELAKEFQTRKIIFASSSSVYGVNQKIPFSEEDPIFKPISPYAATKLAGEALCHVYHHLYDLDIVCLRFFTVYGARQRPDLAIHKFAKAITEGKPVEIYGDGTTQRDYTYIDDILQGVTACLDRKFGYEVINLGESRTVKLAELLQLIEKALGKSAKVNRRPPQPGDVPVTTANIAKARRLLDYNPQVGIEEGIQRFVAWFKKQAS
jgi:UDP-glucuronate 4-epimerase